MTQDHPEARQWLHEKGKEPAIEALKWMLLIRHFETRGEAAYQQGLIGGFFHAYSGQEAIQTAAVHAFGQKNWWVGFYRCHALALLLGASPESLMAELYGKANGNARGRGGSMHFYTERMLGGFAIVGGHLPIAAGAAFSLKYLNIHDELAICFLGEGAVAQGAFHEALNLAALWKLPVVYIIENNQWGMGTHVTRALAISEKIAETQAQSYNINGYTVNGMDYFACYELFEKVRKEVLKEGRPVLIECLCERLRGHSISDPGLYRSKEQLQQIMKRDPISYVRLLLQEEGLLTEEQFQKLDQEAKKQIIEAMQAAEASLWPTPWTDAKQLETEVYAP